MGEFDIPSSANKGFDMVGKEPEEFEWALLGDAFAGRED